MARNTDLTNAMRRAISFRLADRAVDLLRFDEKDANEKPEKEQPIKHVSPRVTMRFGQSDRASAEYADGKSNQGDVAEPGLQFACVAGELLHSKCIGSIEASFFGAVNAVQPQQDQGCTEYVEDVGHEYLYKGDADCMACPGWVALWRSNLP